MIRTTLLRCAGCILLALATLGIVDDRAWAARQEPIRIAFISNNAFDFWTIAEKGCQKAEKEFGVTVITRRPARGTPVEQRRIIEDLLTKGVHGIAISPNDALNQKEFLDEVASKVPLITQDSDLPPGSKRLCYIGTNNFEAGRSAGELVKKALPQGGQVMIFVGKLDVQNAIERRNGVIAALAGVATFDEASKLAAGSYPLKIGAYEVLGTRTDNADRAKCKSNAEDTLVKYPRIRCLVGLWEYNPPALLAAVKDAGKEGQVLVVGFDENEETLQGIKDGFVQGTIVQQPFEFGYQSVRILAAIAKGDRSVLPESGIQYVPHREIHRGNVDAFRQELKELKGK